jgi:uncharacterized protein (TIRG00374 family)
MSMVMARQEIKFYLILENVDMNLKHLLPRFKKSVILLIKIAIASSILFFLFHNAQIKLVLFTNLFHHPLLFSSSIMMFLLIVALGAQRWNLLNQAQRINLGFIHTITPTYLGVAFNNILPGAIGGDLIRSYYLFKKFPDKKSTALISIFLDRMLGFLGLIVLIFSVIISHMNQLHEERGLFYLLFLFAIFCISILILFSLLMILPQRLGMITWLENRYSHNRLTKSFISLLKAMRNYQLPKMIILQCLLLSILIQLMATITIMIIANMMGLPSITLSDYIIAFSITQVVNLIPVTPGGIGIGEMAFANILLLLNPGKSAAFATVYLAYRFISLLTYIPGVIFYIPRFMMLKQKPDLQKNMI